jgi:putative effector of murein hydrolase
MVTTAVAEALATADQMRRMQEMGVLAGIAITVAGVTSLLVTWVFS